MCFEQPSLEFLREPAVVFWLSALFPDGNMHLKTLHTFPPKTQTNKQNLC